MKLNLLPEMLFIVNFFALESTKNEQMTKELFFWDPPRSLDLNRNP